VNVQALKQNASLYGLLLLTAVLVYLAVLLGSHVSPQYLWLLVPGAVSACLSYLEYRRLQRKKLVTRLRAQWGTKELKKDRDFQQIAALFEQSPKPETVIDDRTWQDLTMDVVFSRLDRTLTWPGMQALYRILRLPEVNNLDQLRQRDKVIAGFQTNAKVREDVQVILSGMEARIGSGLCTLIWNTPHLKPLHPMLLYNLLFVAALFSPLLVLISPRYAVFIILLFQLNMYLHFKVQKEIRAHFEGVRALRQLISISKKLSQVDADFLGELSGTVRDALQQVRAFGKLVRHVGVESTDPLTSMFQQYFTIFYLAEVRGFYRALDFVVENQEALQQLFLAVGEIDALQSAASYRDSLDYYRQPEFGKVRCLELQGAYHPLLAQPVPNSISIGQRGRGSLGAGNPRYTYRHLYFQCLKRIALWHLCALYPVRGPENGPRFVHRGHHYHSRDYCSPFGGPGLSLGAGAHPNGAGHWCRFHDRIPRQ
jgi:hypothetical protein